MTESIVPELTPRSKEKELKEKNRQIKISLEDKKLISDLSLEELFSDQNELNIAIKMAIKYLKEFSLESISDRELLRSLIHLEVFQHKLQENANDFGTTNGIVPIQMVDALHRNINQIINVKEKLGLTKGKKEDESDALKMLDMLKKKFKAWREDNQGSRTLVCPHCSKMVLLKVKTEAWEAQKHPYFKDRLLGNEHIISLYKQDKLSKEDVAKIFEVSNDYIDWLVSRWNINTGVNVRSSSVPPT
jgi:DNA-directed RNA polymerase subunit RPC12/RpoP